MTTSCIYNAFCSFWSLILYLFASHPCSGLSASPFPTLLSVCSLYFWDRSLTKPGTCQFAKWALQAAPWDPHASSSLVLGLLCLIFYVDAGDVNSGPHDCAVSLFQSNAPMPQYPSCLSWSWLVFNSWWMVFLLWLLIFKKSYPKQRGLKQHKLLFSSHGCQ